MLHRPLCTVYHRRPCPSWSPSTVEAPSAIPLSTFLGPFPSMLTLSLPWCTLLCLSLHYFVPFPVHAPSSPMHCLPSPTLPIISPCPWSTLAYRASIVPACKRYTVPSPVDAAHTVPSSTRLPSSLPSCMLHIPLSQQATIVPSPVSYRGSFLVAVHTSSSAPQGVTVVRIHSPLLSRHHLSLHRQYIHPPPGLHLPLLSTL